MPSQDPPLIFIFDNVRLRSHLFFRFLSTSTAVQAVYHPWLPAGMFGPERTSKYLSQAPSQASSDGFKPNDPMYGESTYADCTGKFTQAIATARNRSLIPVANEHWQVVLQTSVIVNIIRGNITDPAELGPNPTHIPNNEFDTLRPIILIRHPINAIDSIHRTHVSLGYPDHLGTEHSDSLNRNQPLRLLFDYFRTQKNVQPIVVDGDDVLWRTEAVSKGLCSKLGLGELTETWTPTGKEEIEAMHPHVYRLTKDIHDSNGIRRPEDGKPGEPDLNKTVEMWTAKYGGEVAGQLRGLVEANMPHYEYLAQFKI